MFTVPFDHLTTLAAADAIQTIASVFTADTLGHRCRIREIGLGCSEAAPVDLMIGVSLARTSNVGAGTTTSVTPEKCDSLSLASIISGAKNYTVEPTTYGLALWAMEMHLQSTLLEKFGWTAEEAYPCNRNELIGLRVTIRTAVTRDLSGYIKFEEF
jgi:hypothetical protein